MANKVSQTGKAQVGVLHKALKRRDIGGKTGIDQQFKSGLVCGFGGANLVTSRYVSDLFGFFCFTFLSFV